jgi:hypothetical protein
MKAHARAEIFLIILALFVANFSMQAQLIVNFSVDKTEGCSLPAYRFLYQQNNKAAAGARYTWDYTQWQKASIVLASTNNYGCYTTFSVNLAITEGNLVVNYTALHIIFAPKHNYTCV